MPYSEIGSEFWECKIVDKNNDLVDSNISFCMTGRTALDAVIKHIKKSKLIKKAYLPSYCCESMVMPFIDNKLKVAFYDVIVTDQGLKCIWDFKTDADIVLLISYFGFTDPELKSAAKIFNENGSVVIEDITHSLLSAPSKSDAIDYSIGSLRKWTGIADGALIKSESLNRDVIEFAAPCDSFVDLRTHAEKKKNRYMNGESIDKKGFLKEFNEAEELIDKAYAGYGISDESRRRITHWDIETVREKRRINAEYLLIRLNECKSVEPLYKAIPDNDTPIFIPVIVQDGKRDALRKHLIDNMIYCPVHWPLMPDREISQQAKDIYNWELSLICDQRYSTEDMDRIITVIKQFK